MILDVLGHVWFTLATLLIFAGIFGVWEGRGFSNVLDLLSPFNVVVIMITLAPGIGVLMLSEKLRRKQASQVARLHV